MRFFKVYLPCQSSTHLRLPPAFVKNFNDKFPKKATLKDTNGILWPIKIEKDEDGVSMKHGWPRFVMDHCLEYGEFLVFRYNGNSLFDVKIYETNGCIKNQGLANYHTNKERRMIPMPVKLEDELNEGKTRNSFRSCKRKFTEESSSISRKTKGSCHATQRKSRRITMNPSEPSKATEFATTKNPNFVDSVRPGTPYRLHIPGNLVTKYNLKFEPEMVFCTQNGSWPVSVSTSKDGRSTFGKGWNNFCVENNLVAQDKCRFEFVFRTKKKLSTKILVTIIRANTKK